MNPLLFTSQIISVLQIWPCAWTMASFTTTSLMTPARCTADFSLIPVGQAFRIEYHSLATFDWHILSLTRLELLLRPFLNKSRTSSGYSKIPDWHSSHILRERQLVGISLDAVGKMDELGSFEARTWCLEKPQRCSLFQSQHFLTKSIVSHTRDQGLTHEKNNRRFMGPGCPADWNGAYSHPSARYC